MPSQHAGKTVAEILKGKRADIKCASLDPGSPSCDEILHLTWEEIQAGAKQGKPGYKTFKKLLGSREYDK
jgi:hypothetical protein